MRQHILFQRLSVFFLFLFWITGCGEEGAIVPQYLVEKSTISLLENYPGIYAQALQWEPDAKLAIVGVTIGLGEKNDITAFYDSPNNLSEGVMVKLDVDGSIVSKTLKYNFPRNEINSEEIINMSEVNIDSADAWKIFINYPVVASYKKEAFGCAKLFLVPLPVKDHIRTIWRLSLGECNTNQYEYFYIDASTGEWLQLETP